MAHMELEITPKGALYCAECSRCGMTMYSHEWASWDCNSERDALQSGMAHCPECGGFADAATFMDCGQQYAARYSASGYLDCTEWTFGKNKRELIRDVRSMYG